MSHSDEIRARVRAIATVAFDAIPAVWPIGGFIATNPLSGYEHLPFGEAIAAAKARTGARGFLPEAEYRKRYARGAISRAALETALDRALDDVANETRTLFGRRVSTRDLVWASLLSDLTCRTHRTQLDAAVASRLRLWTGSPVCTRGSTKSRDATLGEIVDALCGTRVMATIDDRTIVWCAAFLDDGEASWSMPYRDLGFYHAWRRLAGYDAAAAGTIANYRVRIAESFARSEDGIAAALSTLGIERSSWAAYLTRHAVRLPGWAGIAKWRAANPEHPSQRSAPIDPVGYLAVRMWYEAALVSATADRHGIAPTKEAFIARFGEQRADDSGFAFPRPDDVVANLASALELSETEVLALEDEDLRWMIDAASVFNDERRSMLWLEAHERHVRDGILEAIAHRPLPPDRSAPFADVVFCMDVRSEGFRRHLEAVGPYRTRGFAGFYGLPVAVRSLDSTWSQQACPVLLAPKHHIVERAAGTPHVAKQNARGRAFLFELGRVMDEVKGNAASAFVLFESIGALFALPLVGRTLLPRLFGKLRTRLTNAIVPHVRTEFGIAKAPDGDTGEGFTAAERLFFAESALALMGMRDGFARLILLIGHGSTTENNPFEGSLDCGACAGYRGGPNARILAAMLNRDDVRAGLVARGMLIPNATLFVGAEHDTATDRIRILDADVVPASHRSELATLERHLEIAGRHLAAERVRGLVCHDVRRSAAHVEERSRDWAQVRPEWGLARNATVVIAPRTFTAGVDLASRAFLHEYDPSRDRDGALLEIIMTAPLVVAQWINNHYYFATVDNERYGSGTKVIHNVVGRIGVMAGNRGDLRAGLPLQSLADRHGWYHEPLRLLAIVTAPRARIEAVIGRNEILRRLFHNEWIALTAWDPDTSSFWDYTPKATWTPRASDTVRTSEPLSALVP